MTELEQAEKMIRAEMDHISKQIDELALKRAGMSMALEHIYSLKKKQNKT